MPSCRVRHPVSRLACLGVVVLLAAARPALAQGAEPSPARATQAQILDCLRAGARAEAAKARVASLQAAREARLARFKAADEALAAQARQHAPRTPAEAESYNRAVRARNDSARLMNEEGEALRREVEQANARIVQSNGHCAGLLMTEEDHEAAQTQWRAEQAAQAAARASASAR